MQRTEFSLEYELTLPERTEFVRYDTYNSPFTRSYYMRQAIWYGPILGSILAFGFSLPHFDPGLISLIIIIGCIAGPAFLYLDFRWGLPGRVLKSQMKDYKLNESRSARLVFDDEFITTEQKGIGRSQLEWSALQRIARTESCLLLYVSSTSAIIVPIRAIGPPEDLSAFESMLERHMHAADAQVLP